MCQQCYCCVGPLHWTFKLDSYIGPLRHNPGMFHPCIKLLCCPPAQPPPPPSALPLEPLQHYWTNYMASAQNLSNAKLLP